ncbi:MAG: phosphatidylglycerol lysyltransferase domain-containing protein [Clostridiales bacterium]|jgi:hypothetical protein|nr:phosphatidylglycerol lysyltransferase domain-containing protein [Clostridiales bacterium]
MDFKPIEFTDKNKISAHLAHTVSASPEYHASELSFLTLFIWREAVKTHFAESNGCLIIRYSPPNRGSHFLYPFGKGDKRAAIADIIAREPDACFLTLSAAQADELTHILPGYEASPVRDSFDYIYKTADLIDLQGKKYHSKKNHINAFFKAYPDYTYAPVTKDLALTCAELYPKWFAAHPMSDNYFFQRERDALLFVLNHFDSCDCRGGVLFTGAPSAENICAFTISQELTPSTVLIHFEKADGNIRGAYPTVNNLHLRNEWADKLYVNREDDAGLEGLRKSKTSYHPCFMVEKYSIKRSDTNENKKA